jgi:hypothetical protein
MESFNGLVEEARQEWETKCLLEKSG